MKIVNDEHTVLLAQIKSASQALNRAASEATKRIERLEERLVDLEPGVTVWGPVLLTEESEHVNEESGASETVQRSVTLGFGKSKKDWGFVVREELKGKKGARNGQFSVPVSDEVRALLKADRDLRILALPHLQGVLQGVLDAVTARTERLSALLPVISESNGKSRRDEDDEDSDEDAHVDLS